MSKKNKNNNITKTGVSSSGGISSPLHKQASGIPNFSGASGLTSGGGGAFPTSQTQGTFYSPELTTESWLLPKSRQEILKWCRIFYNLEPYVRSIIDMHAMYPFSRFDITTSDPSVTDFYKQAAEQVNMYDLLLRASLSYWKFGESLFFGSPGIDPEDGKWKWEKIILLEPELVEIRQEIFEEKPRFEMVPTEELKQLARSVDQVALDRQKRIPDVVLESVKNNRLIPLDSEQVSMVGNITDPSATRGTPIIQCLFKILIYQDWIRLAQSSYAQRYVFPIELWTIGDAAQGIWPTEEDLERFKNTVSVAVSQPPFSLFFPPIVKYEALSVSGKSFFPITNEYQYIYDALLVGLGVNKNIILGEGPVFGDGKTMALHKLMMVYKTVRDKFENWMINSFFLPLAEHNDLYTIVNGKKKYLLPTISWNKSLDIQERESERKLYHEMWKEGIVSTETLFSKFPDLNFASEADKLQNERGTIFDKGTGGGRLPPRLPGGEIKEVPGAASVAPAAPEPVPSVETAPESQPNAQVVPELKVPAEPLAVPVEPTEPTEPTETTNP